MSIRIGPCALLFIGLVGCGNMPAEPPADTRCERLCADSSDDASCAPGTARCEAECNAMVEGLSSLCSGCLIERAGRGGTICLDPDAPCCASGPEFPNDVFDCAASCAGDVGEPVRDPDPRCEALCGAIDATDCGAARDGCYADCQARIVGTAGLCATCLLDGAGVSGTICLDPEDVCCPSDLEFGSSIEACAEICAR